MTLARYRLEQRSSNHSYNRQPGQTEYDKLAKEIATLKATQSTRSTIEEKRAFAAEGYSLSKKAITYADDTAINIETARKKFFEQFTEISNDMHLFFKSLPECKGSELSDANLEYRFYEKSFLLFSTNLYFTNHHDAQAALDAISQARQDLDQIYSKMASLPKESKISSTIHRLRPNLEIRITEIRALIKFNYGLWIISEYRNGKITATQAVIDAFTMLNQALDFYGKIKYKKQQEEIIDISLNFPHDLSALIEKKIFPSVEVANTASCQLKIPQNYYHFLTNFEEAVQAEYALQVATKKIIMHQNSLTTTRLLQQMPITNNNRTEVKSDDTAMEQSNNARKRKHINIESQKGSEKNATHFHQSPRKK